MVSAPLLFYYYEKNISKINILYFVIFFIFFLPLDRYNNHQEYPLKSVRKESSNLKLISELKSFKFQKSEKENITFLNETLKKIKINCNNNEMHGINLTSNNLYFYFLDKIPKNFYPLIDYIEDPLKTLDWAGLTLRTARDFIPGM
jgi:hypothetical protein